MAKKKTYQGPEVIYHGMGIRDLYKEQKESLKHGHNASVEFGKNPTLHNLRIRMDRENKYDRVSKVINDKKNWR